MRMNYALAKFTIILSQMIAYKWMNKCILQHLCLVWTILGKIDDLGNRPVAVQVILQFWSWPKWRNLYDHYDTCNMKALDFQSGFCRHVPDPVNWQRDKSGCSPSKPCEISLSDWARFLEQETLMMWIVGSGMSFFPTGNFKRSNDQTPKTLLNLQLSKKKNLRLEPIPSK